MPALLLAQAGNGGGGAGWLGLVPFVLMIAIFYVLLILPMRRQQKAREAMIAAIKTGDKIYTSGGIEGTVTKVEDSRLRLRIAPGVEVTLLRNQVAGKVEEESK